MLRKMLIGATVAVVAAVGAVAAAFAAQSACPVGSPCAPRGAATGNTPGAVAMPSKPTLRVSAHALDLGDKLTISGVVPGAGSGRAVEILSMACGFSDAAPTAKTTTAAGGTFAVTFQPMRNTVFYARVGGVVSAGATVVVRPKIELRRIAPRLYEVSISAGAGVFFTKMATVEAFSGGRWRSVAAHALHAASDPGGLIALSSARIAAPTLKTGARLRAGVSQATVGQCYQAAHSAAISG